jgi:hypothetical protein
MLCTVLGRIRDLFCCPSIRLVPTLGPITEQRGPVVPAPQFLSPRRYHRRFLIMAFEITDTQQVVLSIEPLDSKGNPAPVEFITWGVDNPNVIALTPAADGKSCLIAATGPLGTAMVSVKADADLDPNVTSDIVGTFEVQVTGGKATTIKITAGTPTEQP